MLAQSPLKTPHALCSSVSIDDLDPSPSAIELHDTDWRFLLAGLAQHESTYTYEQWECHEIQYGEDRQIEETDNLAMQDMTWILWSWRQPGQNTAPHISSLCIQRWGFAVYVAIPQLQLFKFYIVQQPDMVRKFWVNSCSKRSSWSRWEGQLSWRMW